MSDDEIISDAISKRICNHMNEDHLVSVFAMALDRLPNASISSCLMERISVRGCEIQAKVVGKSESEDILYPFSPPIQKSAEVRSRMVAIHQKLCRPHWSWLLGALPVFIIITSAFIFYGVLYLGAERVKDMIQADETTQTFVSFVFGNAQTFTAVLRASFWFLVIVHIGEAYYAAYLCRSVLKLSWSSSMEWFTLVLLVGFPVLGRLLKFTAFHKKHHGQRTADRKRR